MTTSREFIQLTMADIEEPQQMVERLNWLFAHVSDRLDRLEGLRGKAQVHGHLQIIDPANGQVVGGFTDGSA